MSGQGDYTSKFSKYEKKQFSAMMVSDMIFALIKHVYN